MIIEKKIYRRYFNEILKGNKTFEIRIEDDCRYKENDLVLLKEVIQDTLSMSPDTKRRNGMVSLTDYETQRWILVKIKNVWR